MMNQRNSLTERVYTYLIALAGLGLLSRSLPYLFRAGTPRSDIVFLAILVALGEAAPVPIPKGQGSISVSPPVIFATCVLYGPYAGIFVAVVATLRRRDLTGQVPILTVLFNRGMLALSVFAFGRTFEAFGGVFGSFTLTKDTIPFLASALAYTLVNAALFCVKMAFRMNMSIIDVWRLNIVWSLPNMLALFPLGILMVLVCEIVGPFYLVLFYIPVMTAKISLEKYIELRNAYGEMAGALSNAIDAKDPYTRGHSERVAEYSMWLARELKLSEDKVELIRYVGLLHDVGKVGIKDSIMKKAGPFTFDEYEEMKKHAKIGADILQGMRFLGKGQDWIRYHHERWDGTGFPEGLKGEEIPLEARIIACADAFDAMTTDRPYKKRMSIEDAKNELRRCAGTQFDPAVVDAMLKVIDRHIARK